MNRRVLYIFLLVIGWLTGVSCIGQVKFEIIPSAREIGKEDAIEVRYSVSGTENISNFIQPVLSQWKLLSGPGNFNEMSNNNGKTSTSVGYTYTLQPKTAGTFVLPATTIEADGKRLTCNPVTISVKNIGHVVGASPLVGSSPLASFFQDDAMSDDELDKVPVLKSGENLAQKIKSNIFIKAEVSKTNCMLGEPLLVTYKLYTRLHSRSKVVKQPAFSGCTVYEMTTDNPYPQAEKFNGEQYKAYIIRKVQLFPLQTGELKLDVATVDNTITFFTSSSQLQTEEKTVTLSSEPITIQVHALPDKNKPADYSGAVGKFTVTATATKQVDTAEDNNSLQISISGEGNFQTINCPMVQWPGNTEHFENTMKDDVNKLVFPASGSRIFEIPFVAKQPGRMVIPPVGFSYLDAATQQYKTVYSDSIVVNVSPALKNRIDKSKISGDITNHKYIWIVPAIALLAGLSWWLAYGRKKENQNEPEKFVASELPEEKISEAAISAIEPINYYDKLNTLALIEDNKLFFINAKEMAIELLQKDQNKKGLEAVIKQCNEGLYSPVAIISRQDILNAIREFSRS